VYSFPTDIWSLGVTAMELAEGAPPYVEFPMVKAMFEVATNLFAGYRAPSMHSPEFCDFVEKCVRHNQRERWTIDQLLHPFKARAEEKSRTEVLRDLLLGVDRRSLVGESQTRRAVSVRSWQATAELVKEKMATECITTQGHELYVEVAKAMSTRVPFMPTVGSTPTARRMAGKTYGVGPEKSRFSTRTVGCS
jgi:serine/threonine protein kinase